MQMTQRCTWIINLVIIWLFVFFLTQVLSVSSIKTDESVNIVSGSSALLESCKCKFDASLTSEECFSSPQRYITLYVILFSVWKAGQYSCFSRIDMQWCASCWALQNKCTTNTFRHVQKSASESWSDPVTLIQSLSELFFLILHHV